MRIILMRHGYCKGLKEGIINTYVVSSHGSKGTTGYKEDENAGVLADGNFWSNDKLYLLSTMEVWGKEGTNVINYDSAEAETRQLDYYKAKGVTTSNYSGAIKKNLSGNNANWWLRSAYSNNYTTFFIAISNGSWYSNDSSSTEGVAPAFRIA